MKILHINEHSLTKGGAEAYLFDLIKRLKIRGHECYLAYAKEEPDFDISSIRLPSIGQVSAINLERDLASLKSFINKVRPDLIHIHGIWNIEVIEACLRLKPCLMTGHDYRWLCPDSKFYWNRTQSPCNRAPGWLCASSRLKHKCVTLRPHLLRRNIQRIQRFKRLIPEIRAVVTASRYVANRFRASSFPEAKTHIIPYYCSFNPLDSPRKLPKEKSISIIGRTADYKGIDYFLSSLGKLPADVRGFIMGDINEKKESSILEMARNAHCEDRVTLENWSDRKGVARLLKKTSILIFPSIWPEPFGITGIEAMAFGIPVIGSDIGGIPEWVDHGVTGYLCRPKSSEEIATYATKIFSDQDLMTTMGAAGQESIRDKFLPEIHLKKLEQVYASCLQN